MRCGFKRLMFVCGILIVLCVLSLLGMGWWAASDLVHPSRRLLQDYHQEILGHPGGFGLKISSYSVPAAQAGGYAAPCLLCEPNPSERPGTRGKLIREQLAAKDVRLFDFGKTRGTVVLLPGRGGRKEDGLPIAERFCAAGLNCVLIDLPAHGDNLNPIDSFGLREWNLPNHAAIWDPGAAESSVGTLAGRIGGGVRRGTRFMGCLGGAFFLHHIGGRVQS